MNMDIGSQYGLVKQQVANLAEILGRTLLPVVIPVFQAVSQLHPSPAGCGEIGSGCHAGDTHALRCARCSACSGRQCHCRAIGTVGIVLPAVKAGIAALGPCLPESGSAVSAYFWPVVAVIAAVVIAVIALQAKPGRPTSAGYAMCCLARGTRCLLLSRASGRLSVRSQVAAARCPPSLRRSLRRRD